MMLTQQQYLNLTGNSLIFFPTKGIMRNRQIISSHLYVRFKGTCSLTIRALLNTGE